MTREEAVQILHDCGEYIGLDPFESNSFVMDGSFTADQIEAASMAVRDQSIFKDAGKL